jgi:hypothetical protein
MGRGQCLYRCEDFTIIPKAKRPAALSTQLKLWSPFGDTDYYCFWAEGWAMIWYWSKGSENLPEGNERWQVLPESVFHVRAENGFCLNSLYEGFELQYWNDGVLRHSMWQLESPEQYQIMRFLQGAGIREIPDDISDESSALNEVWESDLTPVELLINNERLIVALALVVLSCVFVWHEARITKTNYETRSIESKLVDMQDELLPLLSARKELQASRSRNQFFTNMINTPTQAHMMVLVSNKLPSEEAKYREWQYQKGELKFVIEDASLDPIVYVRALQSEPLFNEVRAEQARGKDRIQIILQVAF